MKLECRVIDVEVLPNFFGITIINLNDYLNKFHDATDEKGKQIPLVQCLTVSEIKKRLDIIDCVQFYISDKVDNSIQIASYFSQLRVKEQSYHIYSYNGKSYDNLIVAYFLMFWQNYDNSSKLCEAIYRFSRKIIEHQDDYSILKNDFEYKATKSYKLPYVDLDVMRIFALNKAGVRTDPKTGEKVATPKGLKQTSINLQWYELLEYSMPPICDKDYQLYWKYPGYKGLTADELNHRIATWDRLILPEYVDDMMHYNRNDCFIVCEIIRLNPDEIKSRYSISKVYNVDVLNASRSKIGDVMFEKYYSEFSGLRPDQWKGQKTERTIMALKKVIFPFIDFKTDNLKQFLEEIKSVKLTRVSKDEFERNVKIGDVVYTMATGGLHSQDRPMEIWSTSNYGLDINGTVPSSTGELLKEDNENFVLVHSDVNSMYPSIMTAYQVSPAHLVQDVFAKLIGWMKDTRVQVKHSEEDFINGIPRDVLALVLKITINSIYGKFSFSAGSLYDRLATLKVTINGQLMVLMLCEELELNNIHIVSANTDGIMVKVYDKDWDKFNEITSKWQENTKLKLDNDILHCLIAKDVNNYIAQFRTKKGLKLELKGAFDPLMYAKDLSKGYSMPIVPKAVLDYFINKTPIMTTLRSAKNILDFCSTQNVGREWHVEQEYIDNGIFKIIECQRYVRYYISNRGVMLKKCHNEDGRRTSLAAEQVVTVINTLDDKDISLRDINYKFYYEECMKIINPIKLGISAKGSGKTRIKKYYGQFQTLFDN